MISIEPFHEAWSRLLDEAVYSYQIGPFTLQISSNSASLASQLTRAFAHLPIGNSEPDLKIRLWDHPQLPLLDWNLIQSKGYRGYAEPPLYFHYFEEIGALSVIDISQHIAYYAVKDRRALPWWVSGSPLQGILHVWLREKGMQLTHSACISSGEKGFILAGKGGSGKSTTVLACLQEGLSTLGEDYIALGEKRAYSIYQSAKWELRTRAFFPHYESHIENRDTADREKALVYYKDLFPTQIALSCSVQGIVSLHIGHSTCLQESDPTVSLQSLLLSTSSQLPHPDRRTAFFLKESMKPLAHYRLSLGPDLKTNVAVLRSLFY